MNWKRRALQWMILMVAGIGFISCSNTPSSLRQQLDLSGTWQLWLASDDFSQLQPWQLSDSSDTVQLPGSLDENGKGYPVLDASDMMLNRVVTYIGPAVYRKTVTIPQNWSGKFIELKMERTKVTKVWIDSIYVGTQNRIFSPQKFNLSEVLTPGGHTITILVDNTLSLVPVEGSHAYSEDTQTNWNGILGDFYLEASNSTHIQQLKITPNVPEKTIDVAIHVTGSPARIESGDLRLKAASWNSKTIHQVPEKWLPISLGLQDTVLVVNYEIGEGMQLWSEFDPALYKLEVALFANEKCQDIVFEDFGMRTFKNAGTQFEINGVTTFLRGKHDAAVFPLTGYPPMETEEWVRLYEIAKSYGLNHYRFHSWTPPEAAFKAADICGIYLQPETPIWWSFKAENPDHITFMTDEGCAILDAVGNHASFVMFALGNEIYQDRVYLKQMVDNFRAYDNRHLYAQGSNNRGSNPSQAEGDDFWVTFRTDVEKDDLSTDVRGSISFVDAVDGGQINTLYPSTDRTYATAIAHSTIPVIGHEIGQFQVYPNYEAELPKYAGVLKPVNLELFKQRLENQGMGDQDLDFFKGSGALSVLCYREDIERAMRTPGFGGFQLLDLQDYPGQGTALVGLLDAFMDSKGLISPEEFRKFCDEIVIQAIMPKYCWQTSESYQAAIQVVNYSNHALNNVDFNWSLTIEESAEPIGSGSLQISEIPCGGITQIGNLEIALNNIEKASKATLLIQSQQTGLEITYPVWIYPETMVEIPENITVATALNPIIVDRLEKGGKVLLFPDHKAMLAKTFPGQFIAEFWNYGMFTSLATQWGRRISPGTMGILTDPNHPIFNGFPTEFHTDWQWWVMMKNSRPLIFDESSQVFEPIVQVIDNINRNHKLGLVFEGTVGKGKVLVSMINLPGIAEYPEARQLYVSLVNYMESDAFDPKNPLDVDLLK